MKTDTVGRHHFPSENSSEQKSFFHGSNNKDRQREGQQKTMQKCGSGRVRKMLEQKREMTSERGRIRGREFDDSKWAIKFRRRRVWSGPSFHKSNLELVMSVAIPFISFPEHKTGGTSTRESSVWNDALRQVAPVPPLNSFPFPKCVPPSAPASGHETDMRTRLFHLNDATCSRHV
jgi:hypothetical protein